MTEHQSTKASSIGATAWGAFDFACKVVKTLTGPALPVALIALTIPTSILMRGPVRGGGNALVPRAADLAFSGAVLAMMPLGVEGQLWTPPMAPTPAPPWTFPPPPPTPKPATPAPTPAPTPKPATPAPTPVPTPKPATPAPTPAPTPKPATPVPVTPVPVTPVPVTPVPVTPVPVTPVPVTPVPVTPVPPTPVPATPAPATPAPATPAPATPAPATPVPAAPVPPTVTKTVKAADRATTTKTKTNSRTKIAQSQTPALSTKSQSHGTISKLLSSTIERRATASIKNTHSSSIQRSRSTSSSLEFLKQLQTPSSTPKQTQLGTQVALTSARSKTIEVQDESPRSPLELVISPEIVKAIADTASVVTLAGGLVFPPVANTAGNILRTSAMAAYCKNADNLGSINPFMYMPAAPVRLGSEDPYAAEINGALISTTSVMAAIFATFLLTGCLQSKVGPGKIQKAHKALSTVFAFIMSYYGPNVIEIAALSIGHFSAGDRGLSITSLGAWNGAFLWSGFQIFRKASEEAPSLFHLLPFYEPSRNFASKPIRCLVLIDMMASYLFAMLSGLKPNPESCKTIAICMLGLSTSYLGYVLGVRPYKSKLEQSLVTISALIQVSLSILNLATLYEEQLYSTLGYVGFAALCYVNLQILIIGVKEAKDFYDKYRKSRNNQLDHRMLELEEVLVVPEIPKDDEETIETNNPFKDIDALNDILDASPVALSSTESTVVLSEDYISSKPPSSVGSIDHSGIQILTTPEFSPPTGARRLIIDDYLNNDKSRNQDDGLQDLLGETPSTDTTETRNLNPTECNNPLLKQFRASQAGLFANRKLPSENKGTSSDIYRVDIEDPNKKPL